MAVAHTVNAVQSPHDDASTGRLAAADALGRALTLDMANWWQPTAANYFARIKKDQILQAIEEATGAPIKERPRSLKKQDLAAEAEKLVTGTRWLYGTRKGWIKTDRQKLAFRIESGPHLRGARLAADDRRNVNSPCEVRVALLILNCLVR